MMAENFSLVRPLALVLAAVLLGASPPSLAPAAAPFAVPVVAQSDHLYADVRLDGSAPLRFAVDTSGGEIVDAAVAARLHLAEHGRVTLRGVGTGAERARLTRVGRVELGGARLDGVDFVVLPIQRSFGLAEGVRIDGVIGPELLARFTVTIDAAGGTMTLGPRGSGPPGDLALSFDRDGHPQVACTVDGLAARCALDTGSRLAVSLLRPFLDAHPALDARATTAEGVDGYGIGGPARGRLGPVEIGLGERTVRVVGDYTAQRRGAFASRAADANLGEELLRRFVVTYDAARRRVRFVPSAAFDEPQRLDRSGLFLVRPDADTVVLDVRPGTPAAAAGVRANDAIVAVDGTPAAALSLDAVRARLRAPGGAVVALRLRGADGTQRDVAVALADYARASASDATVSITAASTGSDGSV